MGREQAVLLIQAASLLSGPDADDIRRKLLAWAEELIRGDQESDHITAQQSVRQPVRAISSSIITIFALFKHNRYEAELDTRTWRVKFGGRWFASPSAAAAAASGVGYPINGWQFWRYEDPSTGESRSIDALRSGDNRGRRARSGM